MDSKKRRTKRVDSDEDSFEITVRTNLHKMKRPKPNESVSRKESKERVEIKESTRQKEKAQSKTVLPLVASSPMLAPIPTSTSAMNIEELPKRITIEPLNKNKTFSDILTKANKEPQFLMKLRNLLSGCNRTLEDKKLQFKRKWDQLRFSNCSRPQYMKREDELKKLEVEEVKDIKEDIMNKLGYSGTKGFETKEAILDVWRQANPSLMDHKLMDEDYQRHRNDQLALLEMLMKESDLVSQQYNPNNIITRDHSNTFLSNMNPYDKPPKPSQQNKEMERQFNNLQSQQNPQNVQFFFMKQFTNLNYPKIFENAASSLTIDEKDKFYMSKKTYSWLLDSKSDQIYSNEKFQGETYDKYTRLLRQIHDNYVSIEDLPTQVVDDLLQIATYVLNSIHYYQKFKLKCSILHPLDVSYVIEKIRGRRQ